ncbi:MAG: sigma-54-dependent Fis family transcriptional regulator [Deltaproteobacteria bacterium]|nr:sigma-54-dependent Fis family transcriptional regulator [Deltaproteobacteria bacterium]MBW2076636.1 sigma-54-dependent Fis family transcriptional regulator [Deltaproteobacteria bacterium]MBW2310089.1 sigma-54-dependent Fis family transcriptional regulator [Deltaproteobacteria bacterium]
MSAILVVDDELSMREFLEILLTKEGYAVSCAENGEDACTILDGEAFDLVITDIRMDTIDGLGVLRKVKEVNPETPVIIISAYATAETAVEAMKEGAYDYIPKPFEVEEFKKILRDAIHRKAAARGEEDRLTGGLHFGCLIGESPQMKKVYELIRRVAETKTNILISGESGTGKELVARAIHEQSPRSEKPFVVINCAGIPETLIESELFGYKKGAFTGANTDKGGFFEAAHGGTVFFDEVGELSPAIQVKLLRVIQEKTFTRIGETQERSVDVRFISATNKSLEQEVIDEKFREDLFFRLNVIEIPMPPLREREGDLYLLAHHFLAKYSKELEKDIKKVSAYAMDILGKYSFPGNIRELENIIERSVALETSNIVLPQSLTLSDFKKTQVREDRRRTDLGPDGISLDEVMAETEREYILRAMEMAHGSKQRAAELLGISFRSLRYRMEKLGL